jgi:hypothetical protein
MPPVERIFPGFKCFWIHSWGRSDRRSISSYPTIFSVSFGEMSCISVFAYRRTPHRGLSPSTVAFSRIRRCLSALLSQFDWKSQWACSGGLLSSRNSSQTFSLWSIQRRKSHSEQGPGSSRDATTFRLWRPWYILEIISDCGDGCCVCRSPIPW